MARKLEQVLRSQGNTTNIIQKQATEFVIDEQVKTLPKIAGQHPNNTNPNNNNNNVVLAPVDAQSNINGSMSPRKTSPRKNISNSNSSFEAVDAEVIE